MKKNDIGSVFKVEAPSLVAVIHYVLEDDYGAFVRVFLIKDSEKAEIDNIGRLISSQEDYVTSVDMSYLKKQKVLTKIGYLSPANFSKPKYMRSYTAVRGEFLHWRIVNTETLIAEKVKKLNEEQKKMSGIGMLTASAFIEQVNRGTTLDDWNDDYTLM